MLHLIGELGQVLALRDGCGARGGGARARGGSTAGAAGALPETLAIYSIVSFPIL